MSLLKRTKVTVRAEQKPPFYSEIEQTERSFEVEQRWLYRRARALVGPELPDDYEITLHPYARKGLFWKGTYPNGWVKATTQEEVEDHLYLAAADARLRYTEKE